MATYTLQTRLRLPVTEARWVVEVALRQEGFRVLAQIDLTAANRTLPAREEPPYLVLGACNPEWVGPALAVDPSIGALLPCHVVIRADGDGTIVEAVDPTVTLAVAGRPEVDAVAVEIRDSFVRALARLDRLAVQAQGTGGAGARTGGRAPPSAEE